MSAPSEQLQKSRSWLWLGLIGTILMALGSLMIVGVQVQTRGQMREVLVGTDGEIRTDAQAQMLYDIMSRGTMLSIGGAMVVGLGVLLAVLGLMGFFLIRRRLRQAINAP